MPPAFLDAILHRARIPSCPPRAFLKSLPLLPRAACPNRPSLAPLSVLSSTACASSATTCSASLLTDLMPSNAPSVTRDDRTDNGARLGRFGQARSEEHTSE